MKNSIEIIVRCERGHLVESISYENGAHPGSAIESFPDVPCPVCNPPEPTYGPLTVENVAEAVQVAWYEGDMPPRRSPEWGNVARFVIRLLKEATEAKGAKIIREWDLPRGTQDWLNDLARQK